VRGAAEMVYISGGRVQEQREWKRPGYVVELFWALVNMVAVFFQTIFKSPQQIDSERRQGGQRPFFASHGSAGGGGGGGGAPPPGGAGGGGRRGVQGMNTMRRMGRVSQLPASGGG